MAHHSHFEALPTRILGMREDFFNMIKFPAILSEAFAWNNFLSNIENRLFAFSNTEFKLEYSIALFGSRSGYYGSKGQSLIMASISRLFLGDEDKFSYALYSTLESLVSADPDRFDDYDTESELLELDDIIRFVLTPTVAIRRVDVAEDAREASGDFGEIMQPEDDKTRTLIESLKNKPLRARKTSKPNHIFQKGKAAQRPQEDIRTSGPKSPPRALSLNDFPEPDVLAKKTKVKTEKKPTVPKRVPKPNPVKSDYATRARSKVEAKSL
ncbi:hypothetical protein B0H14DRAFT_2585502 [Mycena olivaceomarginata]|nr:hypothetical protein B0H14DRAFT_2585502 [Mycena olivaceomarginata]